jgi:hypothetical protein
VERYGLQLLILADHSVVFSEKSWREVNFVNNWCPQREPSAEKEVFFA